MRQWKDIPFMIKLACGFGVSAVILVGIVGLGFSNFNDVDKGIDGNTVRNMLR